MKTYSISLEESMNLIELDRQKALEEFSKGNDVYVKLSKAIWLMFSSSVDTHLPEMEDGIKYFMSVSYDDDKLIVTRHKNIAQWYRSKGINAKVVEFARPADVKGKTLYGGTIPVHLMAMAKECYIMRIDGIVNADFDSIPYDQFDNFNVELKRYEVSAERVELG